MIYIDILTYEFADAGTNIANLPLDWPYQSKYIYDGATPVDQNWQRFTEQAYQNYVEDVDRLSRYNTALDYYNNSRQLRITNLIDDSFANLPTDKVDFRRHLKNGVYLNKIVEMLKNGRPSYCTYEYNGVNYARIRFEFNVNPFNLVYNKKTYLGFYNMNDHILEEYVLTNEATDLNSIYGLQKAVNERFSARSYIFDEIKSYVNAVLLQVYSAQNKTYEEILTEGGNFWRDYDNEISSWCHIGGMSVLVNKLNQDTTHSFLNFPSGFPNMTVKDWIIDRITY